MGERDSHSYMSSSSTSSRTPSRRGKKLWMHFDWVVLCVHCLLFVLPGPGNFDSFVQLLYLVVDPSLRELLKDFARELTTQPAIDFEIKTGSDWPPVTEGLWFPSYDNNLIFKSKRKSCRSMNINVDEQATLRRAPQLTLSHPQKLWARRASSRIFMFVIISIVVRW